MPPSIEERWRWWTEVMDSPRYILAPMVLQSELAFRMMVRRHGVSVCYAPMLPVDAFLESPVHAEPCENQLTGGPATQASWFTTAPGDRPLVGQLGGGDPERMLQAALLIQDSVDAIDCNMGCPQRCACVGGYGAFLMDDPARAKRIVETLVAGLRVPVTAKIRIMPTVSATIEFARMLEDAGVSALTVHGRLREQRHHEGPADWATIAAVKAALKIPVIANGNCRKKADADACILETGVDAVMSATALLPNPRLFASAPVSRRHTAGVDAPCLLRDGRPTGSGRLDMALEYLECCRLWPNGVLPRMMSDHLLAILRVDLELEENADLQKRCKKHRALRHPDQFAEQVVNAIGARRGDTKVECAKCLDHDQPHDPQPKAGAGPKEVGAMSLLPPPALDPAAIDKVVRRSVRRRRQVSTHRDKRILDCWTQWMRGSTGAASLSITCCTVVAASFALGQVFPRLWSNGWLTFSHPI